MTQQSVALTTILHEIRTPIQTVLGTAELLKSTKLDSEQEEYVRQIMFSAEILHTLANDILDFEKIQKGKFVIENRIFQIHETIERILDLVSIECYNKGLELTYIIENNVPTEIIGDSNRIQQILLNIVKNAVKFTEKGFIHVKVSADTETKQLIIEIIDTGIGIPNEKKEIIFQAFQQADISTTRKYGGTGLGLTISKQLVDLMQGEIGVKDNPKGGSIFWIKIPYQEKNQTLESKEVEPSKIKTNFSNPNILIVDDNLQALQNFEEKLRQLGLSKIHTVDSGIKALEQMLKFEKNNNPFDIVFIDMIMPTMDGWRLAAEINTLKNINGTKLYLMIPEGQLGSEAKMKLLSWFNGYLYKPLKTKNLIKILQNANETLLELPIVAEDVTKENLTKTESEKQTFSVLAVDDHPVNLKILKIFLQNFNLQVFTATNGTDAIKIALENPEIQIIFMDIQLPDMSGLDASKKIMENGFKKPIITCSANPDQTMNTQYEKCGIKDSLIKPFSKQQLYKTLEKWIPEFSNKNFSQTGENNV